MSTTNTTAQGPPPLPPNAHEYRGNDFKAVIIVMTAITLVAISLRFLSRRIAKTVTTFWWDDWVALAALPVILAQSALCFAMLHFGLGHHVEVVDPKDLGVFFKLLWSVYFVYDVALCLTKTSALLFLSRIFPARANSPLFNYTIYAVHACNALWLTGILIGTVFMCDPVEKNWKPLMPGKCGSTNSLWIGSAIPSVIIDLVILILPLPKIWRLRMSLARRSGVMLVFLLGYLVIVVSLGRLITVLSSTKQLQADITYEIIPMAIWVCCEAPVTMLCICLPAMLPLGRYIVHSYFSPLASRVSSSWNSRRGANSTAQSKSGNYSMRGDLSSTSRLRSTGRGVDRSSYQEDGESLHSDAEYSTKGMLALKDNYSARVGVGEHSRQNTNDSAFSHAIRVERGYKVDRMA